MSIFTEAETAYLQSQGWGRLATVQPNGTLQNSPVGFAFDPSDESIRIYGYDMAKSRKFRNVEANGQIAFVVDDVPSTDPMRVRCLEIRGEADAVTGGEQAEFGGDGAFIQLRPRKIISFGIDEDKPPHELRASVRTVS